ncbi:MAG: SirB2 family protein [Allosphingosinicella sp.]
MEAYYLELRAIHIGAVATSGALFLVRALAFNLAGAAWPMARPARILAYAVDTILLVAALLLVAIVRQYPFVHLWVTAKVLLLILYIFLGYRALRGPSRTARLACLAGAAATFLFIVTVARAHHPLGLLANL